MELKFQTLLTYENDTITTIIINAADTFTDTVNSTRAHQTKLAIIYTLCLQTWR